jgi:hypothetical protein
VLGDGRQQRHSNSSSSNSLVARSLGSTRSCSTTRAARLRCQ